MRQSSFVPDSKTPRISGTKEWSSHSSNCLTGCSHDCRYCYARERAVRFRQASKESWSIPKVRPHDVSRRWRKVEGTIMFPTTHDILPEFLGECATSLLNMLRPGNRVLIVSKPHLSCIRHLCAALIPHKSQVLFRFTIGADDDDILRFWEPGAPAFAERLASLEFAKSSGYATSVSIEPMLDSPHIRRLVATLSPFVSDSIWIGKLNRMSQRVTESTPEAPARIRSIREGQTDAAIRGIYEDLKNHPLIRWKESIKEIIGLALAERAGLDR